MPGGGINHGDGNQEKQGAKNVEHVVLESGIELVNSAPKCKQAHGRHQHDLEPDVQVEQVGRGKSPTRTTQHPMQERQHHGVLCGAGGAFATADLFNLYVWFEVMPVSYTHLTLPTKRIV